MRSTSSPSLRSLSRTSLAPSTPSLLTSTCTSSSLAPLSPHASLTPSPSPSLSRSRSNLLAAASVRTTGPSRRAASHHARASSERSVTRRGNARQGAAVSMNWRTWTLDSGRFESGVRGNWAAAGAAGGATLALSLALGLLPTTSSSPPAAATAAAPGGAGAGPTGARSNRLACGFCHAHSNWSAWSLVGKPDTTHSIYHGRPRRVLKACGRVEGGRGGGRGGGGGEGGAGETRGRGPGMS